MALLVNAQGHVDQVEILRNTGSWRLDKAAASTGVPVIVMPYAAVAREIDAATAMNREGHLDARPRCRCAACSRLIAIVKPGVEELIAAAVTAGRLVAGSVPAAR